VQAETVGGAMRELARLDPSLGEQLLGAEGGIRRFVRVFVGADDAADLQGPETRVAPGATLRVVPAIAGGSTSSPR
jgi:sulfur-carrier protein